MMWPKLLMIINELLVLKIREFTRGRGGWLGFVFKILLFILDFLENVLLLLLEVLIDRK